MPIYKHTSNILKNLKNKLQDGKSSDKVIDNNITYLYEVSVVTPSYKGEKHILRLLNSIKNQSLAYELFEIIIIINGELDSTKNLLEEFMQKNPDINLHIVYSNLANASNARNIGIETANGKYVTFVDDDDYISSNYLEELYKNASDNRIVIARMENVDENNNIIPDKLINEVPEGIINNPNINISRYFSFNACKLIPSSKLKKIMFDVELTSGEDIVFFANLIINNEFEIFMVEKRSEAIYYRVMRSNSVSRRPISYKFNVEDRLSVIKRLNIFLSETNNPNHINDLKIRINGQTSFINKYLNEYPNEYGRVLESIKGLNLKYFNMKEMNRSLTKMLYISFCFLPYNDISSYFVGKRIVNTGKPINVISNNMEKLRRIDNSSSKITTDYIINDQVINAIPTIGNWKHIKNFCETGLKTIDKLVKQNKGYKEIYSYSMYPASNLLAFNYKLKNPEVKWIAEFSDQLIYETIGDVANSTINDPDSLKRINSKLVEKGYPEDSTGKIFFLNEYLPYAFADEIIFQSKNQKEYMLEKFPFKKLLGSIENKSRIIAPPMLKCKFYTLTHTDYPLNSDIVNFAYFDSVYEKICLEHVYSATKKLKENFRDKFMIHIFTNNPEGFKRSIKGLVDDSCFKINPSVNFLEFLNLTIKFDCLIVTDQKTMKTKPLNPFLPSKLSDYIGSGTDIWGICEEGSAMSFQDLKYKSDIYDPISNQNVFVKIIENHLKKKF